MATDLSDRSKIVEGFALSFAKRIGAAVTLLHNTWPTYKSMEDVAIQTGAIPLIFKETIQTIEKQSHDSFSERRKNRGFEGFLRGLDFFDRCGTVYPT